VNRAPYVTSSLLALLLLASGGAPVRAEEGPGPGSKPARRAIQALETIEKHAVLVAFRYKKDLEAEEQGALPPESDAPSEAYRFWRMSMRSPGFVVRDRRTVIISDVFTPLGAIASVEVRPAAGGEAVPGRVRGFLRRAEAVIVECERDLPVEPLVFPEDAVTTEGLLLGSVAEGASGAVESWVDGLGALRRKVGGTRLAHGVPDAPTRGLDNDGGARSVDLVLAPGGAPVGFRFGADLDLDEGIWRGKDVLADAEVSFASLKERAKELGARSTRARIEVTLRTTKRDDREDEGFGHGDDGEAKREHWGVAVGPDLLLVAARLEPDEVRRIEHVRFKPDDSPGTPATYVGKVRGYDAYVVRVERGAFEALPEAAPAVPPIGAALLVHVTAWRGGARRDQVDMNRVLGFGRRYGDQPNLALERPVTEGALMLTADGEPFAIALREDPEDKEEQLRAANPFSRRERPRYPLKAVVFKEVGSLAALARDPDTRVMPQEEVEAKRLPWLGVETTGFSKEVAEMLDISAATRDGQRGLLVGRVYEGSPAAKAGIQVGDILLSARRTSGPGSDAPPVDLAETHERRGWFSPWDFMDGEGGDAPSTWRSQDTALHRMLKSWGEKTTYELLWLTTNGGGARKQTSAMLTVELSPASYESAPRARDELTGLTVRDLTFEVRAGLRLSKDAPGVVVARIEPGSPASQARIAKNEVLQEIEGKPVVDSPTFAALLAAFRSEGRDTVRVVVRRLDKTRLVDLRLAPSEDAGPGTGEGNGADPGR
jgi:hypothetical protein